jgi:hypothetical protein
VVGFALTASGFVAYRAYRGREKTTVRPIAAACMTAGMVMLFIVGLALPVGSTTG